MKMVKKIPILNGLSPHHRQNLNRNRKTISTSFIHAPFKRTLHKYSIKWVYTYVGVFFLTHKKLYL